LPHTLWRKPKNLWTALKRIGVWCPQRNCRKNYLVASFDGLINWVDSIEEFLGRWSKAIENGGRPVISLFAAGLFQDFPCKYCVKTEAALFVHWTNRSSRFCRPDRQETIRVSCESYVIQC
jgi:hypothetical protein